jgi:tetratricopeptide (TPR) repeat protein
MPEPVFSTKKRRIQAVIGLTGVILVLILLVLSYPWLQLQLANRMIQSGSYSQAEQILQRLVESKPEWTEPRYKLAISQLYLGKGREAAATVISLADASKLDDLELAIIFLDVAEHLLNTGHGDAALELADRVLAEREDAMLEQAVVEIGFMIAEYYDLPLTLDALKLALSLSENNWLLNRKAFNLLLGKALEAPPHLAEPALDLALKLYPNNIIALTRKASLLSDRSGAKEALNYLLEREPNLLDNINQEYLSTKRSLIFRLANSEPSAELAKYTLGMPQNMVVEIAIQGLNQAWRHGQSGYQYYQLAVSDPGVAYQYGRNLFQLQQWDEAKDVFKHLHKSNPDYANFKGIFSALDASTVTVLEVLPTKNYMPDMVQLSPDGNFLAWRRWLEPPWDDEMMTSTLVITDLSDGSEVSLGDVILFKWSPDGKYLAYLTISPTGWGRMLIYSQANGSKYAFSSEYDIIDFNWAGNNLMVQAERNQQTRLIHLVPPAWQVKKDLEWDLNSVVNQEYTWLSLNGKRLLIHENQNLPQVFTFDNELVSFTDWSPDGRLAVTEDEAGKSWLYNCQENALTAIEVPGRFAAWAEDQQIFWYLPLWEKMYVLVKLDSSGKIREYLPYSFSVPHYDITIALNGSAVVLVEEGKICIHRK